MARYGGRPDLRDGHILLACAQRPHVGFGGVEFFPGPFAKAAAVGHAIAAWHPFMDGNKRTAYLVAKATLHINGLALEPDTDDADAVMVALAKGEMTVESFAGWLEANCRIARLGT